MTQNGPPKKDSEFLPNSAIETQKTQKLGVFAEILPPVEALSQHLTIHGKYIEREKQTSLKWYSTIAVLSGTLAPAGTLLKNNDTICPAD